MRVANEQKTNKKMTQLPTYYYVVNLKIKILIGYFGQPR